MEEQPYRFYKLNHIIMAGCLLVFFTGRAMAADITVSDAPAPLTLVLNYPDAPLAPARKIIIEGQPVPEWRIIWEEARQQIRSGDYEKAVKRYQALLVIKTNLEEARWELARLQLHLRHLKAAAALLELLVEADPQRSAYLNALGLIMYAKGSYDRAIDLFGQAYRLGADADAGLYALTGLIDSLLKTGKKREALSLLEELFRRKPAAFEVRRTLALLAVELGAYEKARLHLAALADRQDAGPYILLQTARVHQRLGLANLAAAYWQRLLTREPADIEAHAALAVYYENAGRFKDALPHLLAQEREDPVNPVLLAEIGRIILMTGEPERALVYYERYLNLRPDDPEVIATVVKIQEGMAHDLVTKGEDDEALSLWKRLAKGASNRLAIYRAMADLLTSQGRDKELRPVLEVIHGLDPADDSTTLRLALMYLDNGMLGESKIFFGKLAKTGCRSADFFFGRGVLYEKLNQPERAITEYESMLKLFPARDDVRLRLIRLAGALGSLSVVLANSAEFSSGLTTGEKNEIKLIKAATLRDNGFYWAALDEYRPIAAAWQAPLTPGQKSSTTQEVRDSVWLAMAATYRAAGLNYEAEQTLRLALNADPGNIVFAGALFELTLRVGRYADAENWLRTFERYRPKDRAWEVQLFRARLLAAKGDGCAAVKIASRLFVDFPTGEEKPVAMRKPAVAVAPRLRVGIALCRFLLSSGRVAAAERISRDLLAGYRDHLELFVLRGEVLSRAGDPAGAEKIFAGARALAAKDPRDLLRLAELYRDYGDRKQMYDLAMSIGRRIADSLKAKFLLVEALEGVGKRQEALALLAGVMKEYPANTRAMTETARLLFKVGRFEEALAQCEAILALAGQPERPDILLLQARVLWAAHRWPEALAVYKAYLASPVEKLLAARLENNGLVPELSVKKRTFWDIITFSTGEPSGLLEVVMSPLYAAGNDSQEKKAVNALAVPLYARYRWQEKFAGELEARQAVQRREYNRAVESYDALLADQPNEGLLFDLAGIYSQMGCLGKEAAVYEQMRRLNPDFPGLADAARRNMLKRRPRLSVGYGRREDESWDSHRAIQKEWRQADLWFSPRIQHEFDLTASRIRYRSTNSDDSIWSKRAFFSYRSDLTKDVSLSMGGGIEDLDDDSSNTGVFMCSMLGKIGDRVKGRIALIREMTADTIASLTRKITQQNIEAGITIDFFPRLLVGGKYGFTDYSDNNQLNKYTLWSSYILFTEPTLLKFSYRYDFKDAGEGVRLGTPTEDGFAVDDHPYWSPKNYWLNRFTLYFKHQLADDTLKRGIPKYYIAEYSLGYDSRGYDMQTLHGGFFMELTNNFIVEAAARVSESRSLRNKELSLSATYRW